MPDLKTEVLSSSSDKRYWFRPIFLTPYPPSVACWLIRLLLTPLRKEASSREIELSLVFNDEDYEKEKEITEIYAYQEIEVRKTLEKYFKKDP